MAITTFKTSPITTTFKGGSQCDVHRLVLPSLGQHRQLRQGAAVLQGSLHPLPNPIFSLILILMPIFVHQSIKNSSARLSSSSILIPFLPSFSFSWSSSSWTSSSCSSFLTNPSWTVLSSSSSSWRPSSSGPRPQPHPYSSLIKSIIISFLISLVITIISWWSQSWWSVFTILMISVQHLDDQRSPSWWSAFTILILMLITILMIRSWWTSSTFTASTIWGTATRKSWIQGGKALRFLFEDKKHQK